MVKRHIMYGDLYGFMYVSFFFSAPLLHVCIPKGLRFLDFTMKSKLIDYLNAKDIFHKVLSDMVNAWKEMMLLSFFALGTHKMS